MMKTPLPDEPVSYSEPSQSGESKWARLVREIEDGSLSFGDYYEQSKKDCAEFRRDFRFKHDMQDEEDES